MFAAWTLYIALTMPCLSRRAEISQAIRIVLAYRGASYS